MIVLPWPPKELSPNARCHWRKSAPIRAKYRADCYLLCKASGIKAPEGKILWVVEFFPPDRRAYDDDNLLARTKALRDGVAEALGVDDRRFVTQFSVSDQVVKGGAVHVHIKSLGSDA
ncbi:MAG: endodeoxyribonuclease RusA [Pseudomonadaceae bacterium]|nr:endodeoxyribonuclease RusA [Pseudomonadaceae bacterium]